MKYVREIEIMPHPDNPEWCGECPPLSYGGLCHLDDTYLVPVNKYDPDPNQFIRSPRCLAEAREVPDEKERK